MQIPKTASMLIQGLKMKGTLGLGGVPTQLGAQQATQLDDLFSKSLDETVKADNQAGYDRDIRKGHLLIQDEQGKTEIEVKGSSKQGSLTEVSNHNDPASQIVRFTEANADKITDVELGFRPDGVLNHAVAYFISRQDPQDSYCEFFARH